MAKKKPLSQEETAPVIALHMTKALIEFCEQWHERCLAAKLSPDEADKLMVNTLLGEAAQYGWEDPSATED